MPHEEEYGYEEGTISEGIESTTSVDPVDLPGYEDSANPFMRSDVSYVAKKLSENVGNPELDKIRSITLSSLVEGDPFDDYSGARRAVQILYSCGKGHFITHAFGFSDEFLSTLRADSESISGKPLSELVKDGYAHGLLYREYFKGYSREPYFNPEFASLTKDVTCYPPAAENLVRLLLLLVISIRLEG